MTLTPRDVVRIDLDGAHFYVQCIYLHPTYHEILAVDLNRYDAPVAAVDALSFSEFAISPVSHALQSGRLSGQVEDHILAARLSEAPLFKFAVRDNLGQPIYWWLWDGNTIEVAGQDRDISALPERKLTSISELTARWTTRGVT